MNPIVPPAIIKSAEIDVVELMKRLRACYARITAGEKQGLDDFLDMGDMLNTLKPTVEHGQWLQTLAKLGIPSRRAQQSIQAAKCALVRISECASINEAIACVKEEYEKLSLETGGPPQIEPGENREEDTEVADRAKIQTATGFTAENAPKTIKSATAGANGKPKPERNGKLCNKCQRLGARKDCQDCAAFEYLDQRLPPQSISVNGTEKPDIPKDELGHEIPEPTRPAFESNAQFTLLDVSVRVMQTTIDELSRLPGGEQLRRHLKAIGTAQEVKHRSEHLENLKRDLRGTRPYSICPYCSGKPNSDCRGCNGTGWVTKFTWDSLEQSQKARLS